MSKIAAHCPRAADERMASGRLRPLPALAGALVLAGGLAALPANEAAAQSRSGIVINNDVLNSLGPGLEAAPLAPLAPDAPPTPLSPRSQPSAIQAPLAPPPDGGSAGSGFQAYGDGSYVVTRPGTLLFPPPQDPASTLTPGFTGAPEDHADNHTARARALDSAFAEGPEPSSQLLIPLDGPIDGGSPGGSGNSVLVFMENLPDADPDADRSTAPVLTLRAPPQPSPPKPTVPPAALAVVQPPVETTPLAPEFVTPEPLPQAAPEVAEKAEMDEPEQEASQPEILEPEAPEAAEDVDETPAPELEPDLARAPGSEPAPAMAEAPAAPRASESAADSPTPGSPASNSMVATGPAAGDAPVSLLPRAPAPTTGDSQAAEPVALPAGGLQTASLSVEAIEDRSFLFEVDSADLSPDVESDLRALAEALLGAAAGDIQVLGFASGQDSDDDQARKLALSRALKVRSFLIDAGIPSARIRVRSLGDRADGGPANRVDIRPIGS